MNDDSILEKHLSFFCVLSSAYYANYGGQPLRRLFTFLELPDKFYER